MVGNVELRELTKEMEKYEWKNIGESAVLYVQFLSDVLVK